MPDISFPDCETSVEDLMRREGLFARLDAIGGLRVAYGLPKDEDDLVARIGKAEGVLLGWHLPSGALARLKDLRVVSFCGTGASAYIDVAAATRARIAITNTPDYAHATVAEHTFALLLALARRVPLFDARLREGRWDPEPDGVDLAGGTLGLIGYGGIARHVARIASGFGMKVIAWTRSREDGVEGGVRFMPFNRVLAESDFVSLHLALMDQTRNLLDGAALARLKPGAILINTARGALVDEDALAAALRAGKLGGAGVDVFTHEPMRSDHPLRGLANVVLTPHVGYKTPGAQRRLFAMAVENLEAFFAGAPRNVINPEALAKP
jgi:phosphoglycerate dehydrogenase-like enzyme